MQRFSFAFVVDGLSMDDVEQVSISTEGCAGLTLAEIGGVTLAVFEREAESADRALTSALDEIETNSTIRVLRLDQDLVSVADIAQRTGRSRQSVRLLADGERGPGDFPDPVGTVGKAIRVWEWASVNEWLRLHEYGGDVECLIDADTAAVFDGMLAGRRRSTPEAGSPPLALRK